jgi:hypothetical protein
LRHQAPLCRAAALPYQPAQCDPAHDSYPGAPMTITATHIPAIVALIAGILILLMPRLLNLVVAIYLICVGLIGLGALRFLNL